MQVEQSTLHDLVELEPIERRKIAATLVYQMLAPMLSVKITSAMQEVHTKTLVSAMLTTIVQRPSQTFERINADIAPEMHMLYKSLVTLLDAHD